MIFEVKAKKYFFAQPHYSLVISLKHYAHIITYYKDFEKAYSKYKENFKNYKHALNRWKEKRMFALKEHASVEDFKRRITLEILDIIQIEDYEDLIRYYLKEKSEKDYALQSYSIYKPIFGVYDKNSSLYLCFGEVEFVILREVF